MFKDASKPKSSQVPIKDIKRVLSPTSPSTIPDYSAISSTFPTTSSSQQQPIASKGGKLSKFGAVKVVKSVNFDEIEAKAKLEREEADRRGLGFKAEDKKVLSPIPAPIVESNVPASVSSKSSSSSNLSTKAPVSAAAPVISKEQQEAMDRLGMGMRKMNINQSVSSSSNATAASAKIKQQGISSEQFSSSSRNSGVEDSFVNDRLREIDTSKGISSDAFFGRSNSAANNTSTSENFNDDDDDYYKSYNSLNNYSNITNSAKDFASRIAVKASSIDIKGMKKSISTAGSRLSAYLQDLQNKQ